MEGNRTGFSPGDTAVSCSVAALPGGATQSSIEGRFVERVGSGDRPDEGWMKCPIDPIVNGSVLNLRRFEVFSS